MLGKNCRNQWKHLPKPGAKGVDLMGGQRLAECGYQVGDGNRVEKRGGWGMPVIVHIHCVSWMNGGVLTQTACPVVW